MITKICKKCGQEKGSEDFHKSKGKKDGLHSYCKECAIINAQKHYQENRTETLDRAKIYTNNKKKLIKEEVDRIKENRGCVVCPEKDPCCLDFHHPNDKDKGISYLVASKSLVKLVREMQKCICICSNCHRKLHANKLKIKEIILIELSVQEIESLKKCLIYSVGLNEKYE
jgi:hypothetical protein